MSRGLEESFEILELSLVRPLYVEAPPEHQFKKGHPFGKWRVNGRSYMETYKSSSGQWVRTAVTPVRCTCKARTKDNVRRAHLVWRRNKSCGCPLDE